MKPATPRRQPGLYECRGLFGTQDGNVCFASGAALEEYERLFGNQLSAPVLAQQKPYIGKRARQMP